MKDRHKRRHTSRLVMVGCGQDRTTCSTRCARLSALVAAHHGEGRPGVRNQEGLGDRDGRLDGLRVDHVARTACSAALPTGLNVLHDMEPPRPAGHLSRQLAGPILDIPECTVVAVELWLQPRLEGDEPFRCLLAERERERPGRVDRIARIACAGSDFAVGSGSASSAVIRSSYSFLTASGTGVAAICR